MTLLESLGARRAVYFCGLAKNAGKTVALRQVCEEARARRLSIAVTSVGRDGEAFDAIYKDFPKPLLHFEKGDLVVTSEGLLPETPGACSVIHRLSFRSPLGRLVVARVHARSAMEVAGPSTVRQLRAVKESLATLGVDLFLVDGALDRKAATLPDLCDGIVLSTGAALSPSMPEVVSLTKAAVDMLELGEPDAPCTADTPRFSAISGSVDELTRRLRAHSGPPLVVPLDGAVTEALLDHLLHAGLFARAQVVADSFSKIVVGRRRWAEYLRMGLQIRLARAVKLLALTVNPVSPTHEGFDPLAFLDAVKENVTTVPVFDVHSPAYREARC